MPVTSGAMIGPYKIDREIGRGGMGVVFLATDTRLQRTVALKALPEDVASDPDRLQRFEREARVLASLNHPNIAAIYGLEESGGRKYLALEHIEGETLADRVARGPLPLPETLDICIQIAAGMEAAHDAGVVHRDLKPANVMITPGDAVKVLDFGLAKGRVATDESGLAKSPALVDSPALSSPTLSSPTLPHSPTFINPATMPGVILGTAAYLSPEQARGKVVDRRTDIWSFGCVLYESLTGKRAFDGETVSDTIAKILERPMDWSGLPKATPPRLRELLERCLEKDPKRRLRDIGDARLTLDEIKSGRHATAGAADAAATTAATRRRTTALALSALLVGTVLGAAAWNALSPASHRGDEGLMHLAMPAPPDVKIDQAAISRDGKMAVLLGTPLPSRAGDEPRPRLYLRRIDQGAFAPLAGTEGAVGFVLSPNGRWVEFFAPPSDQNAENRMYKMPLDGSGPPVALGKYGRSWGRDVVWLESGDLLISVNNDAGGYVRVPGNGGDPTGPRSYNAPAYISRLSPVSVLPGDRGVFLRAIWYEGGVYKQGIAVLDLKSGKTKLLIRDGGSPVYARTGQLLFTRQDALLAVPFDAGALDVKGEPVAIMNGLRQEQNWINADFGLSDNGMLIYAPGANVRRNRRMIVVDRDGKTSDWSPERQPFEFSVAASPDGNRLALQITNSDAITEIWISDRGQPTSRKLPVLPGADCGGQAWSPDGRRVAYLRWSQRPEDGVYVSTVDGSAPPWRLSRRPSPSAYVVPISWSPDGGTILATLADSGSVAVCSIAVKEGVESPLRVLLGGGTAYYGQASFSRTGRSIVYTSNESGKADIYLRRWEGGALSGPPVLLSRAGGTHPRWSRDGKSVFYASPLGKLMEVAVVEAPALTASPPREIWDTTALRIPELRPQDMLYDLLPDGRLVVIQRAEEEEQITHAEVVVHFFDELKRKMRAAGK